ncbi:MAG: hypothetical protein Q9164_004675 [Protoblastenia rupestris]
MGNPQIDPSKEPMENKWISYLTTQYNDSMIETYNLALTSSTVDGSLIPHGADLVSQVQETFIPNYGSKKGDVWDPSTTLFASFIGVNDVEISASNVTAAGKWDNIFQSYSNLADQARMAMNLSSTYSDVSVFTFETDVLFNLILDDPSSIKETAQITNTTGSCPAYRKDVSAPDQSDPSCSAPYNQYFWQDGLHPMFTVHQAIAAQVAEGLRG